VKKFIYSFVFTIHEKIKGGENMDLENIEKRIIREEPILKLSGGSSYDTWSEKLIYKRDLENMSIGSEITIGSNIIRDTRIESIKCLYKDEKGILLYHVIEIFEDRERNFLYDDTQADLTKEELIYIKFY
jgi:hypothetical protein